MPHQPPRRIWQPNRKRNNIHSENTLKPQREAPLGGAVDEVHAIVNPTRQH